MMDCDTTGVEPDIALDQVQEAGRRGLPQDRQQDRPIGPQEARLHAGAGRGHRQVHRRARDDRGRARPQARAPGGVRLRLQAGQRRALHPLHGPHPDDGRDPAIPQRRDQQDREHARGGHGGGHRRRLHGRLEAGSEGHRDLSRRLQALAAAVDGQEEGRRATAAEGNAPAAAAPMQATSSLGSRSHTGAACRTSGERSRTSSRWRATRATSPSGCTRMVSPARSSSRWPRRARPSAA